MPSRLDRPMIGVRAPRRKRDRRVRGGRGLALEVGPGDSPVRPRVDWPGTKKRGRFLFRRLCGVIMRGPPAAPWPALHPPVRGTRRCPDRPRAPPPYSPEDLTYANDAGE